jgi:hypothetical protein
MSKKEKGDVVRVGDSNFESQLLRRQRQEDCSGQG